MADDSESAKKRTNLWSRIVQDAERMQDLDGDDLVLFQLPQDALPNDLDLYLTLYYNGSKNVQKITSQIALPLPKLKELFPSRFKLDKFAEIWKAFYEVNGDSICNWPMQPQQIQKHEYDFDGHTWRSDVWSEFCKLKDADTFANFLVLNIKLSNDGYLYDEHKNISTTTDGHSRHNGLNWSTLDMAKYRPLFEPIIQFGKKWLPGNPKDISGIFSFRVNYNYDLRRVDILMWYQLTNVSKNGYPHRHIQVSFEPGYPETDLSQYNTIEDI